MQPINILNTHMGEELQGTEDGEGSVCTGEIFTVQAHVRCHEKVVHNYSYHQKCDVVCNCHTQCVQ